jgi:hypothetical protein
MQQKVIQKESHQFWGVCKKFPIALIVTCTLADSCVVVLYTSCSTGDKTAGQQKRRKKALPQPISQASFFEWDEHEIDGERWRKMERERREREEIGERERERERERKRERERERERKKERERERKKKRREREREKERERERENER